MTTWYLILDNSIIAFDRTIRQMYTTEYQFLGRREEIHRSTSTIESFIRWSWFVGIVLTSTLVGPATIRPPSCNVDFRDTYAHSNEYDTLARARRPRDASSSIQKRTPWPRRCNRTFLSLETRHRNYHRLWVKADKPLSLSRPNEYETKTRWKIKWESYR